MPWCKKCNAIIWWTSDEKYGGFCHWCWASLLRNPLVIPALKKAVKELWDNDTGDRLSFTGNPREPLP